MHELQFILQEFGVPLLEEEHLSKREYAINALKMATPQQLLALQRHFSGTNQADRTDVSGLWVEGSLRLFMSHISSDKVLVKEVKDELEKRGISAFVAHEDIKTSKKWEEEIEKALATCDALAAFVSPEFHTSNWTDQEVGYCLRRRVLIIPVGLGATPYGFMGKFQGAQCKGLGAAQIAEKIFSTLIEQPLSSAKLANGIVNAFENSNGFDVSRRLINDLEKITTWTPDMLRRIEQATEFNDQISQAYGVPARVQSIITKHSSNSN